MHPEPAEGDPMRNGQEMWVELRELFWLASVVGGLSIAGVGLAIAVAVTLDGWGASIPALAGHI
jgi:hypothetical protein